MIARDRELLARLGKVNVRLGEVVLAPMAAQNGGELPADGLREVGQALRTLANDMIARADGHAPANHAASPTATCAWCSAEPVARPDQSADTSRDHWCPIDTLARADELDSTAVMTGVE